MNNTRLGQQLIAAGVLGEDQLRIALLEQGRSHRRLGIILSELGFLGEPALYTALASQFGVAYRQLALCDISPAAIQRIPAEIARRHKLFPLEFDAASERLTVAMANLAEHQAIASLKARGIREVAVVLAGAGEIAKAIEQHYGNTEALDNIIQALEGEATGSGRSNDAPAVRLIDALLADAVQRQASDIHFEPEFACLRIRYRIDGILQPVRALHKAAWQALAGRLKVLAGMNIAENRTAQDGHFSQVIGGRPIDFRAAIQPTTHGENLVLRVLDRQKGIVPLVQLGLATDQLELLQRMISRPEGLLLVTGPTGSGKTTTLYSILNELDRELLNIMTLEDPVEYPLPGIRQTALGDGSKLDFASGVRSLLRQDPDVILIGEIRDAETAGMALRAALTGHQVHATLHAASALAAFARLEELGVDRRKLHGNLIGIVGQRLLRRLCPHCRFDRPATAQEQSLLDSSSVQASSGCTHCAGQGYRGRLALLEVLQIDARLDTLLAEAAPLPQLIAQARQNGFRSLRENGLARVRNGESSLQELARVVDLSTGS